jgi:hypothetical protein
LSCIFFFFELESKTPGEKKQKRERERESQTTEASEESSHAPQCTLNPNPKTQGIGEEQRTEREGGKGYNKGIKFSNFVYKISPITGHRCPHWEDGRLQPITSLQVNNRLIV